MWKKAEYSVKPSELDTASSSIYVYVRRNIKETEKTDGENTEIIFECEENEIPKADWDLYKSVLSNTSSISDIEDALVEIAELIGG